jgi:curli biogenesis system outer membrane secretion channel CsgG
MVHWMRRTGTTFLTLVVASACASVEPQVVIRRPAAPVVTAVPAQVPSERVLKRKIAIGRFSNETRYGAGLFVDQQNDRIGKQASDMLATELTRSGKFIVLERQDLGKLEAERLLTGASPTDVRQSLVGVDALILGSVVEFGRETTGDRQVFQRSKRQTARARVNVRLVDPVTSHVFFAADGTGEASTEVSTTLGFGGQAAFDSTLDDKAIAGAVVDLVDRLQRQIANRPWVTGVLRIDGDQVMIAGGARQGLKPGDRLKVMVPGAVVQSPQTGFGVQLPPTQVGVLEVQSFFGDSEITEGSVCRLVSGSSPTPAHVIQY